MVKFPDLHKWTTVVALVGNVGQGKTTLWHRLIGRHPTDGVATDSGADLPCAEISDGRQTYCLVDTPGIDGLTGESKDDLLVWDLLADPIVGGVGLVVGGRELRRGILLALQLTEFEKPSVLVINAIDEARLAGIRIDRGHLEEILGIQVVETVATEGEGVRSLARALTHATVPKQPLRYQSDIEEGIEALSELIPDPSAPRRAIAVRLLEYPEFVDHIVAKRWGPEVAANCADVIRSIEKRFSRSLPVVMAQARIQLTEGILAEVMSASPPRRLPLADRLGAWSRHPATGIPIGIAVLAAMYLFVGRVGAQWLVGIVEGGLFLDHIVPWVTRRLDPVPWSFVRDAVVGDFGLVSVGLTLAFGIVMPVLVTFFLAFNVLEDSGYLARLSILFDRGLRRLGVGGRGLFPLVMGFSCITMALLTTRVLATRKERIIASLLLILGIPCAPLLAVMLVVLGPMPWTAPVFVFGVILVQIILIGNIAARVLPGERSDFIFSVPPMRIPRIASVLRKTFTRSWWFVVEAVPFFLIATFCLFVLDRLGGLRLIERVTEPLVHGVLVLPREAVDVLIMTLIRREAGAGLLKHLADGRVLTNLEVVITLLIMTFFSPCVNAILVMFKERGFRAGLAIIGFVTPYALVMAALLHWVCRMLGVSFS